MPIDYKGNKYANGNPLDVSLLTAEQRVAAFKEFSEGSPALERLLHTAYEKGLETRACCAGHKESRRALLDEDGRRGARGDSLHHLSQLGHIGWRSI